ncbi:unnamed protein product [Lepeophtheirus salmonis]|uniref:(salmon louse) hypothetical protein n=1 Tax=Lepeophtheirus salmonis TaxID=72036 RepID=A0A7R8H6X6_LEPSM|nr:unnamed protein product [Lepeophtheirus salmonis]CAF2912072.1 unnamed protein product [Lepeophtheirus salmonis]
MFMNTFILLFSFYPHLHNAIDNNVTQIISTEEPSIPPTTTINYNNSLYDEKDYTRNKFSTDESISNLLSTTVNIRIVDGEEDKSITEPPILSTTTKHVSLHDLLTEANKTDIESVPFFAKAESSESPVSFYEPTNGVIVKELNRERSCCRYFFTNNKTFVCIPKKCM